MLSVEPFDILQPSHIWGVISSTTSHKLKIHQRLSAKYREQQGPAAVAQQTDQKCPSEKNRPLGKLHSL